ncbi:MAG: thiamine diphosphokinase [Treponemataceae bacterium]
MRIGIFTGGEHAKTKIVKTFLAKSPLDYIIAADSGLEKTDKLNLKLDLIIGDFDSLNDTSLLDKYKNAKIEVFPEDKDFTDTELAMNVATKKADKGKDEIVIFGAGGCERIDHLIYFLRIFENDFPPTVWLFNSGIAFCLSAEIKNTLELKLPKKTTISVFNINSQNQLAKSPAPKLLSKGLHWELNFLDWNKFCSISNRNDKENISFQVKSGRFLVIINSHNIF